MIELRGNLWDYLDRPNHQLCITTNGTVKPNGCCVMGRGCAAEAAQRFPILPRLLGNSIKLYGNTFSLIFREHWIWAFPVKHNWWEVADMELIARSTDILRQLAMKDCDDTWIVVRPGCGNGRLQWRDVKPVIECLPDNVKVITNR